MTMPIGGVHNDVTPMPHSGLPTKSSCVCACGAVYDYGNVVVPARYRGLCGRCAFKRGLRPSEVARYSSRYL
jgi:hypothetical protein